MHLAKGLDHVREKERGEERRRTNKKVEEKRLSKRWIRRRKKKVKLQDAKKAKTICFAMYDRLSSERRVTKQ